MVWDLYRRENSEYFTIMQLSSMFFVSSNTQHEIVLLGNVLENAIC